MGRDKPSLIWRDQTLLHNTAATALATGLPVMVIGRRQPVDWALDNVRFFPDEVPGLGPLGGLRTALSRAISNSVLAIACDMPLLDTAALNWLIAKAANLSSEYDGVAITNNGIVEPLFGVYRQSCSALVDSQLRLSSKAVHKVIHSGKFLICGAPQNVSQCLLNINTPEDHASLF